MYVWGGVITAVLEGRFPSCHENYYHYYYYYYYYYFIIIIIITITITIIIAINFIAIIIIAIRSILEILVQVLAIAFYTAQRCVLRIQVLSEGVFKSFSLLLPTLTLKVQWTLRQHTHVPILC